MRGLGDTSLSAVERRVVERLATALQDELGDQLRGVWLYGSRARGERPMHEDSDVDLLVLARDERNAREVAGRLLWEIADEEGAEPFSFSIHTGTPEWLQERRRIRSFFVHEVDRDKVVVTGAR